MDTVELNRKNGLTLDRFHQILSNNINLELTSDVLDRLVKQRRFVDFLLQNNIKVYGLTTGFADMRDRGVSANLAATLSKNILLSHDAGIGKPLSLDVVLGAMVVRANSLAKGYSGFCPDSLTTLMQMVNAKVIPEIPSTGSLGASGDLAFLARLGLAMQGDLVPVHYNGEKMMAKEALKRAKIPPFSPKAKEGLALTNGTSFMASMIAIAYKKEISFMENAFALLGLFLSSVQAIDAAFSASLQSVRGQVGQERVAEIIRQFFPNSPLISRDGVQDDYCIRCLPQILGPKVESILEQREKIERELNAVTDNPLIFVGDEIPEDVNEGRLLHFEEESWVVLSGGNFHGEYITTIADNLLAMNAKIILTLERQLTYLLNPRRNHGVLPIYLIPNPEGAGLQSGSMITQYTANALAQKIASLALPCQMFNLTSGNEAEDVVSYGATAAERLLEQLELIEQFLSIYLVDVAQSYSIRREMVALGDQHSELLTEKIYHLIRAHYPSDSNFPFLEDQPFTERYRIASEILRSNALPKLMGHPLA